MPPTPPTAEMGARHEEYLAFVNDGRKSKASGSQWNDPADGRSAHDEPFCTAWDGKSTLGKSISVTLEMLRKIREQALGEIPQVGLRWYKTESLRDVAEDWVAVPGDDWREILRAGRNWVRLVEWLLGEAASDPVLKKTLEDADTADVIRGLLLRAKTAAPLRAALADAQDALMAAGQRMAAQELELEALRGRQESPGEMAQWVPRLPWTVVHMRPADPGWWAGDVVGVAVRYQDDGMQVPAMVTNVRVQRSAGNRPHLFVDNVRLRHGDLYAPDGHLQARVCEDDPSIEVG